MKIEKASLKILNKRIKESNERFKNASKAERRVMLAEDVIERLKLKQLTAVHQTFIDTDELGGEGDDSIQKLLNKGKVKQCSVCAKGGMLMAYIGRMNRFTVDAIETLDISDDDLMDSMKEVFTRKQLDLIEVAFEGERFSWTDNSISENQINRAINFHLRFEELEWDDRADARLKAICENIIKNKGNFKL